MLGSVSTPRNVILLLLLIYIHIHIYIYIYRDREREKDDDDVKPKDVVLDHFLNTNKKQVT